MKNVILLMVLMVVVSGTVLAADAYTVDYAHCDNQDNCYDPASMDSPPSPNLEQNNMSGIPITSPQNEQFHSFHELAQYGPLVAVFGISTAGASSFEGYARFTDDVDFSNVVSFTDDVCIDGSCKTSWSETQTSGYFVGKTSSDFNAGLGGYEGASQECIDEFGSGHHLCTEAEILNTINQKDTGTISGWSGTAWISAGGAKYSPAPVPVNDCNGFTHGAPGDYLGSFWMFDKGINGRGGVGHCGNSLPLACCKRSSS